MMPRKRAVPALPKLLDRKIYKTGQTRGADDDVIYQNRVGRNSTVLIPFRSWVRGLPLPADGDFENGSIVLLAPNEYLELGATDAKRVAELKRLKIPLGESSLVFFEKRSDWISLEGQRKTWTVAKSRTAPLGGEFVARVASTTNADTGRENFGFTTTSSKGAGIRVYEYASETTIKEARIQLEVLYWQAGDAIDVSIGAGMTALDAQARCQWVCDIAASAGLLDLDRLRDNRAINAHGELVCPLCREELSAEGFFTRLEQAEGREVHDLTVTSLNLFHIDELRVGVYNHRPYNLAWGCHHCNVVTKDSGITETLVWMKNVLGRNSLI